MCMRKVHSSIIKRGALWALRLPAGSTLVKRIRLSAFSGLIALSAWSAHAQTHASMAARQPQDSLFLGTKTPYQAPGQSYSPPPAGYKPVFINYVGRHGARFLTKAGADLRVWEVLQAAEKNHALTVRGRQVKAMTARLLAIEKNKYEQISYLGKEEQTALGERMLYNYGEVFTGRGLKIITTYKWRTQQSADAFLQGLGKVPGKRQYAKAPDSLDAILRFYDLSPAYQQYKKSAALRKPLDSLDNDKRTKQVATHIWEALFTPTFRTASTQSSSPGSQSSSSGSQSSSPRSQVSSPGSQPSSSLSQSSSGSQTSRPASIDPVSFSDNLYDLYSVQFSLPGEMLEKGYTKDSISLGIAFSKKELEWLDFRSEAQDFLEKGPGFDPLGIQVRVAAPLLADFLKSTGEIVDRNRVAAGAVQDSGISPNAILRFTHAEAIAPFAALLGIPEASTPAASIYDYRAHWQAQSIIPLSANIQWVLYSNGQDWLVKVLLNERESALPIPTGSFPYYRWKDLKNYYEQQLQSIGTGVEDDPLGYLKKLK